MRSRLLNSLFSTNHSYRRSAGLVERRGTLPVHPMRTNHTANKQTAESIVSEQHTIKLPAIPRQIDINHIMNLNFNIPMIFSDAQIKTIKQALAGKPDGKYSKKHELADLGIASQFSIIKIDEKYYGLYRGAKHNKLCGEGSLGKVKFAQDLDTGEWIAVKIQAASTVQNYGKPENTIKFVKKTTADEVGILKSMNAHYGTFDRASPTKGFQTYILMKLVKGKTITNYLTYMSMYERTMSLHHALNIGINIFGTLDRLHNQYHIAHNDLHSGNVMFYPPREQVKVIDFGSSINLDLDPSVTAVCINRDIGSACYMMKLLWEILPREQLTQYPVEANAAKNTIKFLGEQMIMAVRNSQDDVASVSKSIKTYLSDVKSSLPHHEYEQSEFDINMMVHKDYPARIQYFADKRKYDRTTLVSSNTNPYQIYDLILIKRELETRGILASDTVYLINQNSLFSSNARQPRETDLRFNIDGESSTNSHGYKK